MFGALTELSARLVAAPFATLEASDTSGES